MIGPASSSSVTKWLVAPINFTPALNACQRNLQIKHPLTVTEEGNKMAGVAVEGVGVNGFSNLPALKDYCP